MINKLVIENTDKVKSEIRKNNKIYSRRIMRTKNLSDLSIFIVWKIKNFIKNLKLFK